MKTDGNEGARGRGRFSRPPEPKTAPTFGSGFVAPASSLPGDTGRSRL
jgi:hypothetical protein